MDAITKGENTMMSFEKVCEKLGVEKDETEKRKFLRRRYDFYSSIYNHKWYDNTFLIISMTALVLAVVAFLTTGSN